MRYVQRSACAIIHRDPAPSFVAVEFDILLRLLALSTTF